MRKSNQNLNENFFYQLNPLSSYFLGFIMGDGNIGVNACKNKYLAIAIHKQDEIIINKFAKEINWTLPLKEHIAIQKSGKSTPYIRIKITNKNICDSLAYYDIFERKTGKEDIKNIPNIYKPDYIRGLFDADGCLAIKNKTNNIKDYIFSICSGSLKMVESLQNYFDFGKIEKGNGNCWSFFVSKRIDICKIGKILYHSNDIFFLPRKKQRFDYMPKPNLFLAFGEYKTLSDWSRDNRCKVSRYTLIYRIKHYDLIFEKILTTPQNSIEFVYKNKIKQEKIVSTKKMINCSIDEYKLID